MYYYYGVFTVFAVVLYMAAVDKNVLDFIDLSIKYIGVQFKRAWWIMIFHPSNPISRWNYDRKINKMVKDLEKEMGQLTSEEK